MTVQEMYYRIGGKPYFALAFRNDSGGYELRNPRFKGSTSKDITHIRQQGEPREKCLVFEGFHGLPLFPYAPHEELSDHA